jgi:hypothetical protein
MKLFNLFGGTSKPETEIVANEDSQGYKLDYFNNFSQNKSGNRPYFGETLKFDAKKAAKMVQEDPVVRAEVSSIVDAVIGDGYFLKAQNSRSGKQKLDRILKNNDYEEYLRNIVANLLIYNNALGEVVRPGTEDAQLNVLEMTFTQPNTDDNGDVNYWFQNIPRHAQQNTTSDIDPEWGVDEVVHYKLDSFDTNVLSIPNLRALYETVLIKDYIRQWLHWFFKTNQMRPVISVPENTSKDDVKQLLSDLKNMESKVNAPLPVKGEVQVEKLQSYSEEAESVHELLRWCDEQISILMQAPQLALGVSDSSGEANAEKVDKYYRKRVKSIRRVIKRKEENETYDKLLDGTSNVALHLGGLEVEDLKIVLETVRTMRQAQFKPEAIEEFLERQGMVFETEDVLFSQEEIMQMSNKDLGTGNEGMKGNVSADEAESRERQPEDTNRATRGISNE